MTRLFADERHIIQQDGVLVKNIEASDEGVYKCRARVAELGALDSRDIQVEVLVPPKIDSPPEVSSNFVTNGMRENNLIFV